MVSVSEPKAGIHLGSWMSPGHCVGALGLRATATVMSYGLSYSCPLPSRPLWDQGSMAQKSVEVESCIPGARPLAEAGDKHCAGRQEQVWTLAGCSPCSHDSRLAKGLPACTSLKEVCATLRVWALGLAGCSMAAQN